MGLCKCPKKKVTNQFCFVHRVNVCEHCMMANHPKCIVQSYLQWLQDSDYNPICELCHNDLVLDDCVRLVCYHVFHWPCLDRYAKQLPANTAPAGYTCPSCKMGIFPPENLVSPVADRLNERLAEVNWARAGLGLPLVDELPPVSIRSAPDGSNEEAKSDQEPVLNAGQPQPPRPTGVSELPNQRDSASPQRKSPFADWKQPVQSPESAPSSTHSLASSGSSSSAHYPSSSVAYPSSFITGAFSPKRLYDTHDTDHLGSASYDHDENKYKRRSAVEWFGRWFKSSVKPSHRRDPHLRVRRYMMIGLLLVIGLLTVILVMSRLGRANADADPFLDPLANPNIRVINNEANQ